MENGFQGRGKYVSMEWKCVLDFYLPDKQNDASGEKREHGERGIAMGKRLQSRF
jgi:hypothetical protein